jgi:hypothetical protein
MEEGAFTISTRVYLDAARRTKLEALLRHQARDLDDLLSELVAAYLDAQEPPPEPGDDPQAALREELRRHRGALRRLRPALNDRHNPPPPWLTQMAADLEREIARLEAALNGESAPRYVAG